MLGCLLREPPRQAISGYHNYKTHHFVNMASTTDLPYLTRAQVERFLSRSQDELEELRGVPMSPEAAKALASAVHHLDGLIIAHRALCEGLGA
jgi:hypothetical protein